MDSDSLSTRDFRRILLIKFSAMGDVVHTIPVLHKLRRRYPDARIDWLLRPALAELIGGHPALTRTITFSRARFASLSLAATALRDLSGLVRALRGGRYDLVIDLQGQLRSALLTLATGAPVRIGFDRPRAEIVSANGRKRPAEAFRHAWRGSREGAWLAYTHRIRLASLDVHAVDRYLLLGPMLGLDDGPPDFSFPIDAAAFTKAAALVGPQTTAAGIAVIAPGTVWETKHWQSEGFAAVANRLAEQGFAVALVGAGTDARACAAVARMAPAAINLAGKTTLAELAALVSRSALCLANDSGVMHLAVALGRPVVGIFGPTDSIWIGPYRRPEAVVEAGVPCAPCYLRRLAQCPYDHACMREVTPDMVLARIEAVLKAERRSQPASASS